MKYPKITKKDLKEGLKKWEEEQKNRKYPYITLRNVLKEVKVRLLKEGK